MARPAAILDILLKAQTGKASADLAKFDRQLHAIDDSSVVVSARTKTMGRDVDRTGGSFSKFGRRVVTANQGLSLLGKTVSIIKWPAMISGSAAAAQGVSALTAGTTALTGALLPATGAATGMAAAYGALGQSILSVKLATVGFGGALDAGTAAAEAQKLAIGGTKDEIQAATDATKAYKDQLKLLTPEARRFVEFLNLEGREALTGLQETASKSLFPGVERGLESAMGNFNAFNRVVQGTAGSLGFLADKAGQLVGSKAFGKDFEKIGLDNARLLRQAGEAGLNFASALRHVMVAAGPLVNWMGKMLVQFSEFVNRSAKAGRENGDLADFFDETRHILEIVVPMLGDFGKGLWNIMRIGGSGLGEKIWEALAGSAEEFRKWTESASGKNAIVKWFEDAKAPLWEAGRLVRDIGEAFFDLGASGGSTLTDLLHAIRVDMLPALLDMSKNMSKAFGPTVVESLTSFVDLFASLAGSSGPLTIYVKVLGKLADTINWLIKNLPGFKEFVVTAMGLKAVGSALNLLGLGALAGPAARGALAKIGTKMGLTVGTEMAGGIALQMGTEGAIVGMLGGAALWGAAGLAVGLAFYAGWKSGLGNKLADTMKVNMPTDPLVKHLKTLRDQLGKLTQEQRDNYRGTVESLRASGVVTDKWAKHYTEDLDKASGVTKKTGHNLDWFGNKNHSVWDKVDKDSDKGSDRGLDAFRRLGQGSDKRTSQMAAAVGGNVAHLVAAVLKGYQVLGDNTNKALKAFGVKVLNFNIAGAAGSLFGSAGAALGGGGGGKQRGGPIDGGTPSGDSVPALLERGEYVLNRQAVAGIGKGQLDAINFGKFSRFKKGGAAKGGAASGGMAAMVAEANKFEQAHFPYVWGGGHGGFGIQPVDCSGAVSDVLHAGGLLQGAPMVSGALASWGQPGKGPVTVYANPTHTFMSLNGRFFGTSGSNPGGGAGWIEGNMSSSGYAVRTMDVAGGAAMATKIARVLLNGPDGPLKDMGQAGLDKVRDGANKYIASKMPSGAFGGGDAALGKGIYDKAELMRLWSSVNKNGSPSIMAAIALAESSGNPAAHGPPDGRGLWQIEWPIWGGSLGHFGNPYDPAANARMAGSILSQQGLGAWVVYNTGAYRQFLQKGGAAGMPYLGSFHDGGIASREGLAHVQKHEAMVPMAKGGVVSPIKELQHHIKELKHDTKDKHNSDKQTAFLEALLEQAKELAKEVREQNRLAKQSRAVIQEQGKRWILDAMGQEIGDVAVRNSRYAGNGRNTAIGVK